MTSSAANGSAAHAAPAGAPSTGSTAKNEKARQRDQEMVFFDLESNIFPSEIIEFGAVIVDKFSYRELERVHIMIQPQSGGISSKATKIHGITFDHVRHSPFFPAVAPRIFDALDQRIWVGHNINSFDTPMITRAFAACGATMPVPHATLDTLPLVRRIFGKRAGDCKMATLGHYFNLGTEKHRAVEDSEMTLQAMKCIALHHLLENEMPAAFPKFEAAVAAPASATAVPSPAAAVAPVPTADAEVDQLARTMAEAKIRSDATASGVAGEPKPEKPKKKKKAAAPAATTAPAAASFIDPSLLGSSSTTAPTAVVASVATSNAVPVTNDTTGPPSAAPVAAAAAPAAAPAKKASEDDGWVEIHSKKALKLQQQADADAHAAAEAKKAAARKLAKQKKKATAGATAGAATKQSSNGSASSASSQNSSQESTGSSSIWSSLVKSSSAAAVAASAPKAKAVAPPTAAAAVAATSSTAAPAAAAAAAVPAPILSAADLEALAVTIDYYVENKSRRGELVYSGGAHPGEPRTVTQFTWSKRPNLFTCVIVGNRHGASPVTFSTAKCVSLTLQQTA